jgi:hypothetical protein
MKLLSWSITFEVKLPSACSFIVDGLALLNNTVQQDAKI